MTFLTREPISLERLLSEAASAEHGGTCAFLGTVRRGPEDADVTGIEYSGYEAMLEAEFGRMVSEVSDRWPEVRVALQHRLGLVATGEPSVAIVAAAPHRAAAFEACRYLIEAVKARAPVWKRELRADGTATWVDPSGHAVPAGPQ